MLQRDAVTDDSTATLTYSLYAANKIYDENEGYTLGYIGSASFSNSEQRVNDAWSNSSSYLSTDWTAKSPPGIYLGGFISGSLGRNNTIITRPRNLFTGSFQEFRYYATALPTSSFYDYVMNPQSITAYTTSGSILNSGSSYRTLAFRADLGSELSIYPAGDTTTTVFSPNYFSIHPAKSGSYLTSSFSASYLAQSFYKIQWWNTKPFDPKFTSSFNIPNVETYYYAIPSTGTKTKTSDNIHIVSPSYASGNVLSQYTSIEQKYPSSGSTVSNTNLFEAGFSPQEEINDDIIASMGRFDIGEYIGDPRLLSQSFTNYPDLDALAVYHFNKYNNSYNISDYIRLIKYIDNSLFKTIKDYIPAKTDASTGVIIKQHLLERNRHRMVLPTISQSYNQFTSSINSLVVTNISGGNYYPYDSGSLYEFSANNAPDISTGTFSGGLYSFDGLVPFALDTTYFNLLANFITGSIFLTLRQGELLSPRNSNLNLTSSNPYVYSVGYQMDVGGGGGARTRHSVKSLYEIPITLNLNLNVDVYSDLNDGSNVTYTFALSSSTSGIIPKTETILNSGAGSAGDFINVNVNFPSYALYPNETLTISAKASTLNSGIGSGSISSSILTNQQYNLTNYYGITGLSVITSSYNSEFYNGEYSGSTITATTQSLFNSKFLNSPTGSINLTASSPAYVTASDGTRLANYQFENSDYYPLVNNINDNRLSTYYQDVDFSTNPFYPVNLNAVLNNLAPAQTPDSNYSSLRHIISKYSGSKLIAADYNKYSNKGATVILRDGTLSSSWQGDTSYGANPVIESNPQYFAHFTYAYPSLEDFNTFTFNIDQIIPADNTGRSPSSVTGDSSNRYFTSRIFAPGRRASVILAENGDKAPNVPDSILSQVTLTSTPPFVYTLPSSSRIINRSGLDYDIIISNEISTLYNVRNIQQTSSFTRRNQRVPGTEARFDSVGIFLYGKPSSQPQGGIPIQHFSYSASFLATGSNCFVIADSSYSASFIDYGGRYIFEVDRPLVAIHNYNYLLANNLTSSTVSLQETGFRLNPNINTNNPDNYYTFNSIKSGVVQYPISNVPFLVKRNDIIRVSYVSSTGNPVTQEFTVLEVDNQNSGMEVMRWWDTLNDNYDFPTVGTKTSPWSKFIVTPDPSTLSIPIPHNSGSDIGTNSLKGTITIKRPREDNRIVNIKYSNPSGSNGIQTLIGEGYIVPDDLSPLQKQQVQSKINGLLSSRPEAGTEEGFVDR